MTELSSPRETLLDRRLAAKRSEGQLAFLPFLVVGDPEPNKFLRLADAMVEAGADALELGLPYSDPPADGPIIQEADNRALRAGVTTQKAFELITEVRQRHDVPVSLLVYFNLVMQAGINEFFSKAQAAGIDAILVPDVPLELAGPIVSAAQKYQISHVCLATAVSNQERVQKLGELCEGYVYAAARMGVTGVQSDVERSSLHDLVERLRTAQIELPILAGFGLSQPEHADAVRAAGADGFIVGSAIIKEMAQKLPDFESGLMAAKQLATQLSTAAHRQQ